MFFSSKGKVYIRKCYEVPEAGKSAKGNNIVNLLPLEEGEKITAFLSIEADRMTEARRLAALIKKEKLDRKESDEEAEESAAEKFGDAIRENGILFFVTKRAVVKRVGLYEFASVVTTKGKSMEQGIRALKLDEDDELLFAERTDGTQDLFVAASNGLATRFAEDKVRIMSRAAGGVRAMRLAEGESVCGAIAIAHEGEERLLATITENGVGKFSSFDEFTAHNRGGKGMKCQKIGGKAGNRLVGVTAVAEGDEILIIASDGKLIRVAVDTGRVISRGAAGVRIMKPKEGSEVIAFQRVTTDEDLEAEEEAVTEPTQTEEAPALSGEAPAEGEADPAGEEDPEDGE